MSKPIIKKIPITSVVYDLALQMRENVSGEHVADLAEAIKRGVDLPPIKVWPDGEGNYMGDGNHTYLAHDSLNKKDILAEIHAGGRQAALKYALSANKEHDALKRTKADKQKAVKEGHKHFPNLSVRKMADLCAVSPTMVQLYRENLKKCTLSTPEDSEEDTPPPTQLDFWQRFTADTVDITNSVKAIIEDKVRRKQMETDPERAASELEKYADSLTIQVEAIKTRAKAIREGLTKGTA